ncbi:pentatricopeptide repeat-containing protein At3g12770-like [Telopea speciosissima]|uniref:pentatricopeptide repeat-containing protein At3g12770-like n=1 Tax=Telopea speciosissima TaxID=54955 RepID=UPI001CC53150|nr:pentatricopeptide repeat-containing protein At3g12770-like [Telopea speciosissima]
MRFFCTVKRWKEPFRDSYEYSRLLQRYGGTKGLEVIHAQIVTGGYEQNPFLAAKLVSQYADRGELSMEDARKVFDRVCERDILLWNVVIQGYANSGPFVEAVNMYDQMRRRGIFTNRYTFPFVLKACASLGDGKKGGVIHGHVVKVGLEADLFVGNAFVAFYAKCKEIKMSRRVFDEIHNKDLVSWNSMISGYMQNGFANEALIILHQLLWDDTVGMPDHATLVSALPACAQAASIQEAFWIHSYIIKTGMNVDAALGSGLITVYANCGCLDTARKLFDKLSERNIVVWNAMIRCYGMHGHAHEAIDLFSRMVETGVKPDGISFVSVLSACCHVGLVDEAWKLFYKMEDYTVEKNDEHYACMVDLLGRAGYLDEAVKFIENMPVEAGKNAYGALLGACRIHNNIELGEEVAERLFVLDPNNAGRYIILAKMYEDAGRWEDVARLRKVMRLKKIKKPLGCSTIEVDNVIHTFGVEDESHPMTGQIFDTLERLEVLVGEEKAII